MMANMTERAEEQVDVLENNLQKEGLLHNSFSVNV